MLVSVRVSVWPGTRLQVDLRRRERRGELLGGFLVEHARDAAEQAGDVREQIGQVARLGVGDERLGPAARTTPAPGSAVSSVCRLPRSVCASANRAVVSRRLERGQSIAEVGEDRRELGVVGRARGDRRRDTAAACADCTSRSISRWSSRATTVGR